MENMNKEEKRVIGELERKSNLSTNNYEIFIERTDIITILNYIDKLQKENENYKELILVIKEKLNNIQFEVEQTWRKIEKLENKDKIKRSKI